jgi:hypothetical protein
MNGLFANKRTRIALALVLALAGAALILIPNGMLSVIGGNIYLWMGLVGSGFVTGAWIAYRIITGIEPKTAAYEGFLLASLLSISD